MNTLNDVYVSDPGAAPGYADQNLFWKGSYAPLPITEDNVSALLRNYDHPVVLLQNNGQIGISGELAVSPAASEWKLLSYSLPYTADRFGDAAFRDTYGVKYALYGGAMANGIASADFVIALGQAGFMGSFGAGGLLPQQIEKEILHIKSALEDKPFIFNLINSPFEPGLEESAVVLYLKHGIRVIEASAYLRITRNLVWYRAAGLSQNTDGSVKISHRVIAKCSRKEVAGQFLEPAPAELLKQLVDEGKISEEQARLAILVPMADDITVEADSGGHTDNRPLVCALPAIIRLRDQNQEKRRYRDPVRIGAGGGIATPESALAAFMMGAAYVVTGSVNQACIESGASPHTKKLLAKMEMTDVAMAPAGDMFEMGVKVQVLKRGTMFAMRAQKLYDLYSRYESLEDIPGQEREKIVTQIFNQPLETVWEECKQFFSERDPKQIERAEESPKAKMALVFRWYLGLSSRWANTGEQGREMDYQIWCGPAMGAFNDWVRGTYLEEPENRKAADVSLQILKGAAYLYRIQMLEACGVTLPRKVKQFKPEP